MPSFNNTLDSHRETITNFGYLGLLPFFMGALGPWVFAYKEVFLIDTFTAYASVILAFLAGSLWSIALFTPLENPTRHINTAMALSLWAFFSLWLPAFATVICLLAGFLWLLFWEKCFLTQTYPAWYQQLRHKLTWIVVACHMMVLWNLLRTDTLA